MKSITNKNNKKLFTTITIALLLTSIIMSIPMANASAMPVTVTIDDPIAKQTTDYSITFTTTTSGIVEAMEIIFPDGFDVSDAELVSAINLGPGALSNPGNGQTLRYIVEDSTVIPAGRIIAIHLSNIVNINEAGNYTITVTTRSYYEIIDAPVESEPFTILPILNVNPGDGYSQTEVSITGKYFGANKLVTLTFDDTPIGMVTTNSTGDFTTTYKVNASAYGYYYFKATNEEGFSATADFWAYGTQLYLEEDYGASGIENLVEGYGFSKNSNVNIVWDLDGPTEVLLETVTTDSEGTFECAITIPDEAKGEYIITATDENGNSDYAFFELIEPQIDIQYDEGIAGSVNGLQGFGFSPLSNVILVWDADGLTEVALGTTVTETNGRFLTNYTVPDVASGTYNITTIDENLKEASTRV